MDGTPLDTSSCTLCSEGREPRGCWGLAAAAAPRFLKLVAIPVEGSKFTISISPTLRINRNMSVQLVGVVCRKSDACVPPKTAVEGRSGSVKSEAKGVEGQA